jgi:hypothetical protein
LNDSIETPGKELLLRGLRARISGAGAAMFGYAGLISVIVGGVTAYIAERFPPYIEVLQTAGGLLLIVGFGLVGTNWPAMI